MEDGATTQRTGEAQGGVDGGPGEGLDSGAVEGAAARRRVGTGSVGERTVDWGFGIWGSGE